MNLSIHPLDLTIIVVYLLGVLIAGLLAARNQKETSGDYFLASRSLKWPVIGLALFATNISTVHLVGLAAEGYRLGLVVGNFEWMAAFCLILLGMVFAPFYFRNKVTTLPEYLERRYSSGSRIILAVMGIIGALFIHIGMSLYAGSVILKQFFGVNIYLSIGVISIVTTLYTVVGGLKAVVVTESIQTVLLLFGAVCITLFAIAALPSVGIESYADFQAAVKPQQLSMIQSEGELSWYAILLGYPVLGIWYWCADQTIVQRVLGARSMKDAQMGPLFAGFIKILPVFFMVLPGVMAWVLFRDVIGEGPKDSNKALPTLIDQLVPVGLKGLITAGLLAALMSTIAGALNSAATLVSIDIVKKLKPATSEHKLIWIGRITACVVMILAMAWSTQGGRFESIFKGLNQMIACLAPPITTVFIWGVFWKRGTQQASLITLTSGLLIGLAAFVLDFGEEKMITKGWGIPFMLQAWWLFCICSVIYVIISLLTKKPTTQQTDELCWNQSQLTEMTKKITRWSDPRLGALVLATTMLILYYLFA